MAEQVWEVTSGANVLVRTQADTVTGTVTTRVHNENLGASDLNKFRNDIKAALAFMRTGGTPLVTIEFRSPDTNALYLTVQADAAQRQAAITANGTFWPRALNIVTCEILHGAAEWAEVQ